MDTHRDEADAMQASADAQHRGPVSVRDIPHKLRPRMSETRCDGECICESGRPLASSANTRVDTH